MMGRSPNMADRMAGEMNDAPGAVEREPLDAAAAARARLQRAAAREIVQEEQGVAAGVPAGPAAAPVARRRRPADRKPFGSHEQQLTYPPIPGFHLYWFNDTPGRIGRALAAGYEHVQEVGKNVSRNVGRGEGSQNGLTAFLMKIPQEWYDEDMEAQQDELETRLRDIRAGRGQGENQYTVKGMHDVRTTAR